MVSFDVESLFTNIPTTDTIEIILNRDFKNTDTYEGLNKPTLRKKIVPWDPISNSTENLTTKWMD